MVDLVTFHSYSGCLWLRDKRLKVTTINSTKWWIYYETLQIYWKQILLFKNYFTFGGVKFAGLSQEPYGRTCNFRGKPYDKKKSPARGPYASSDRGTKTRTALLEKGVRNEANAAMNAFSLRQKNSKTQRSYDKMLIDWVRSGRTWRYLVLSLDARTSLRYSRSVRPDLEPNIFPSGPPTQSISTYNSRRKTNLKNFTFRISWLPDIYESIDLC